VVRARARRRLGQDPLGVLPQAIGLGAILELDPEPPGEDGEVVLDRDRALGFEATDQPLAPVIARRADLGAARPRARAISLRTSASQTGWLSWPAPRGRQRRPSCGSDPISTKRSPGTASSRRTLLPPRLTLAVVVERHAGLDPTPELELGTTGGQELRRVAHGNGPHEPLDLVVEVDAGRIPHHDLVRLVPLEPLDRAPVHPAGRVGVAQLVVDDAAAVGGSAQGDVVEAEPIEARGHGADHG
jgi:hypothetical protein